MCSCGRDKIIPRENKCKHCRKADADKRRAAYKQTISSMPIDQRPRCKNGCGDPAISGLTLCASCEKKRRSNSCSRSRYANKLLRLQDNKSLVAEGKKVCSRCLRLKQLCEFKPKNTGLGGVTDICDACLTQYQCRRDEENRTLTPTFWRKMAYSTNSGYKIRLSKRLCRKVTFKDMPWLCTGEDIAILFKNQNGKCIYCGGDLIPGWFSIDHRVPVTKGGAHILENLDLVCPFCQTMKKATAQDDFKKALLIFVETYIKTHKLLEVPDKEPGR
jgi:hypothetical protein